jgi:hypothetical protein
MNMVKEEVKGKLTSISEYLRTKKTPSNFVYVVYEI